MFAVTVSAQTGLKRVYNEEINPLEQIDQAIAKAKLEGKFVICQVGGNWCPWCLRFADFITKDPAISKIIEENYEYIHVNYNPRNPAGGTQVTSGSTALSGKEAAAALMKRLNYPDRFGFPVFVVLDENGKVIHIQDSSFLEEEQSYNKEKVLRFFTNWTPNAVKK